MQYMPLFLLKRLKLKLLNKFIYRFIYILIFEFLGEIII